MNWYIKDEILPPSIEQLKHELVTAVHAGNAVRLLREVILNCGAHDPKTETEILEAADLLETTINRWQLESSCAIDKDKKMRSSNKNG